MKKNSDSVSFVKRFGQILHRLFGHLHFSYEAPAWVRGLKKGQKAEQAGSTTEQVQAGGDTAANKDRAVKSGAIAKGFAALSRFFRGWFNLRQDTWLIRVAKIAGMAVVAVALVFLVSVLSTDRSSWVSFKLTVPEPTALESGAAFNPLIIDFSGSAARIDLADKTVAEGINISPAIKGGWRWNGDAQLIFRPQEDWACAQGYHVEMDPKIFGDTVKMLGHSTDFSTRDFQASISSLNFSIDPRDDKNRRVAGTISFNYPIDVQSLKGKIELKVVSREKLGNKDLVPVELSFDQYLGQVFIMSDRLPIPKDNVTMELWVSGGIQTKQGAKHLGADLRSQVSVPGIYDMVRYREPNLTVVRNENYEYQEILNIPLSGEAFPEKIEAALSVWLLPADRKGIPGMEDEEDHSWYIKEIDRNVLAQSVKLEVKRLPTEHNSASLVSFVYQAPAGRQIYFEQAGMVEAFGGYVIKEGVKHVAAVPEIPKALDIMANGSVLSLGGSKTLSVVSNDIDTVRFQAKRLFPDQVNHLITQTDGDFVNMAFRDPSEFSADDMSTVYEEVRDLQHLPPGAVQYYSFDFSRYLERTDNPEEKHGLFMFRVAEYDHTNQHETGPYTSRFILVTDLGILAKRSPDLSYDIFVQNIRSGQAASGARVEVLGRNGLPLFSVLTDGNGHARIPSLKGFKREKMPVVFSASTGEDFSFLPIGKEDRMLDFTRFDIGGIRGATDPDKLSAFLFSDRGLYRPGDNINIGYIVKAGDWTRSLSELPLELTVLDPRGVEISKKLVKLSPAGFDEMAYRTLDGATTGSYQINLSLVKEKQDRELLGSVMVRVEEFVPDRLTISSRIKADDRKAWIPFGTVEASIHLMNLYGLAASENPVKASFRLVPRQLSFDRYPDYTFHDAWASDKYYEETLPATTTDKDGVASFNIDLSKFEPGTFQLVFEAEGLEKQGGRSVLTQSSVIVSPLNSIIGWKADGRLDYIARAAVRNVHIVAIDANQKAIALPNLRQMVEEIRYVSVLVKQEDGSYRYQSVQKKILVSQKVITLSSAGLDYALDTTNPGDFEMTLVDTDGKIRTRVDWSVIGKGNLTRSLDRNAELQIKLNRSAFETGDEVELQIKAPYSGSGLITIERDKVYASQWFTTDSNASIQHIRIPEGLEGNAYINVSFVRGLDSREIYMSPLSYGVEPFEVSISKRKVNITLDTLAEAKPGKPFVIKYHSDKPAKIVIYAVDEGILQLAKYATPKPLNFFFQKRALEIETSQILDLILPEFELIQEMAAAGGDEGALGKRQNPFKRKHQEPVAYWSGIIDSSPQTREVSYTIPSYFNGTLRIMAVAVANDAIGSQESKALIRNDFIITPTVPLFVAPGDEFKLGVTVANNAKTASDNPEITLALATDPGLSIVGSARQTIKLAYQTEGTLWFTVKAGSKPGAPNLKLTARAGSISSDLSESLSIRPAIAWRSATATGVLKSGATTVETPRILFPEFRTLKLSASFKPSSLSLGLLDYLDSYPFGCSEQLISKTFPLVILKDDPVSGITRQRADDSFRNTLKVLRARQNDDGSIGLWGAAGADAFVSIYAAQFLTEAQSRGFTGGEGVRSQVLNWMTDFIDRSVQDAGDLELAAYACWVLTLNGKVTTSALTDIRHGLEKKVNDWQHRPAALFLAGSYALLKQQAEADKLLANYGNGRDHNPDDYGHYYESNLYNYALQVLMNSRYRSGTGYAASAETLDKMVKILSDNGFTTISSVQALLAFRAYGERAPEVTPELLKVTELDRDGTSRNIAIEKAAVLSSVYSPEAKSIKFENKAGLPLYWQVVQSGFDSEVLSTGVKQGFEVFREFQDEKGATVTTAKRGQELTAVVRIRSVGAKDQPDVAITDLLPGGFEISLDQAANRPFNELVGGSFDRVYGEAREDRVIMIGTATTKLTEFRYKVKAVNAGSFVVPGPAAEGMYRPELRAQAAAATITVTE